MHKWLAMMTLPLGGAAWAGEPEVRALVVPPTLAAATSNPELSGIAWSQSRQRYLVVTDDAGLRREDTNHAPLLLGLREDGIFDQAPIPIRGVKRINDPESICAGPDGGYFLITSHSPNREGKTGASRRQLLHLAEAKTGLRVMARLDLTKIKGSATLLELAGLPPDGRLDIEAIAFRDGAVFVGFKSPLSDKHEAVIVRLPNVAQSLRAGKLRPNAIERFAAVPLCVAGAAGDPVCQGISDMTFLADGSLVVSANAPKGGPKDHGGALWHLPSPVGKRAPVLLHRFATLKPEGVTPSASGRALKVVFDCDHKTPKWTEVPLPGGGSQQR
ncbi:MAG: hypothetical protein JXP73_02540 [Deltaproteobacteria bacterium]|nr:hypothetical protein [Deltaproteobacteria bacterium]